MNDLQSDSNTKELSEDKKCSMEELLKLERLNRFNNPWSKLDKGTKLNRLHLFIKKEKIDKSLNDKQENQLKTLLISILESGGINKVSEINYSIEDTEIKEIKNLTFDENLKYYSFLTPVKKKKEGNKSKSNIDRHFSRSKETKR
tara:strand:+ start:1411 stop:1845 length:435 start_codon:yes stop_codon:yes gene_type:complete